MIRAARSVSCCRSRRALWRIEKNDRKNESIGIVFCAVDFSETASLASSHAIRLARHLIERAERAGADLILIGTRGLTDLEHLNWEVWRSTAFSWDAVPEKCAKPLRSNQNEVPNRAERLVLA